MKHPDGSRQNYRYCFEAKPGWLMCSADFSGQELSVMAALSSDEIMVNTLRNNGDLHSEAAAGMFNIDPKDSRNVKPGDSTGKTYRDYGKICVAKGTLVSTDQGLVAIENVTPGMKAYTDQGIELVSAHYNNGVRTTYLMTLQGGYQIECTPDHKLRVLDKNGDYVWKEAQDILETDFVAIKPGVFAEGSSRLPAINVDQSAKTSYKKVDLPEVWSAELARFLGYYVSEGSCNHSSSGYTVGYAQVRGRIAEDMIFVAKQLWGNAAKVVYDYQQDSKYQPQHLVSFNRRDIFYWIQAVGCGVGSSNKQIPYIVFQAPVWAQREFLRALFAGDGCITANGKNSVAISYSSKSETLIRQVQQLMLNLGCLSAIKETSRRGYSDKYWTLRALDPSKFLETIGIAVKEEKFSSYQRWADNTEIPNQRSRVSTLQPKLKGKLTLKRVIAGRSYSRTHKEKLYECIRENNPVKLNYSRLSLITSEKQLEGTPEYEYLVNLEKLNLAFRKVTKIEQKQNQVFDITVENQHCFLANGVVAHNCMFSLAYGKTSKGFAADWKISEREAEKIIQNFESKFSTLARWLKYQGELGANQNWSRLPNGAMRFVGGGGGSDQSNANAAKRQSANYQIQGISSWMTRLAMISLDREISEKKLNLKMVACVHDELLCTFASWEGCPYGCYCNGIDKLANDLGEQMAAAKKAKDKTEEKRLEQELENHVDSLKEACKNTCKGKDCAYKYESIIGSHMKAAGDQILQNIVPAGYSVSTRKYWSH